MSTEMNLFSAKEISSLALKPTKDAKLEPEAEGEREDVILGL